MNNSEIHHYIETLGEEARFVGKADEERIIFIEHELEVKLPESYKWFLQEYGVAVIPGFIVLGNGLDSIPACVSSTMDWRKYGLSKQLVVVEDDGTDWIYCLDTSKMENGECPVVDWTQGKGIGHEYYVSFLDFFKNRLQESLNIS